MRPSYLGRQNSCVLTEKYETEILIKKGLAYSRIKYTQFLVTLAWPSTVHKVQNLSLEQGVTGFDLQKKKMIWAMANICRTQ